MEYYIEKQQIIDNQYVIDKKPNIEPRVPIVTTQANYPIKIISIDFLHRDKAKGGFEYVLVVAVDHFTRFAKAFATKTSQQKQQQINYIMIIFYSLE